MGCSTTKAGGPVYTVPGEGRRGMDAVTIKDTVRGRLFLEISESRKLFRHGASSTSVIILRNRPGESRLVVEVRCPSKMREKPSTARHRFIKERRGSPKCQKRGKSGLVLASPSNASAAQAPSESNGISLGLIFEPPVTVPSVPYGPFR